MNIDYLIQLLTNRLNGLALAKDQAFQAGDLERINTVDAEVLDVQNTLSKLKLISSIEQAAAGTPFTEAEVVKNGIEASFNPTIVNDATRCLLDYNIAPYATDPNHESSVQSILEKMPPMNSPDQVDLYIKNVTPTSPLTGQMFWSSSSKFNVDIRLIVALVQQDSSFATEGVAVRTFNPGNIGNDGTNTRTYSSWEEGIDAVAKWLNNHRKNNIPTEIPDIPQAEEPELTPEPEILQEEIPLEETTDPVIPEEETIPEIVPPPEMPIEPEPDIILTPESTPLPEITTPIDPVVSAIKKRTKRIA